MMRRVAGRIASFLLTWIVAEHAFLFACKADDAEDAVEILTDSLNCAHYKPEVTPLVRMLPGGERHTIVSLTISQYLGNSRQLIVEQETTEEKYDRKETSKSTMRANFANLDAKDIRLGRDLNLVQLTCLRDLQCFAVEDDGRKPIKTSITSFRRLGDSRASQIRDRDVD
jgi:hypothetical protein